MLGEDFVVGALGLVGIRERMLSRHTAETLALAFGKAADEISKLLLSVRL